MWKERQAQVNWYYLSSSAAFVGSISFSPRKNVWSPGILQSLLWRAEWDDTSQGAWSRRYPLTYHYTLKTFQKSKQNLCPGGHTWRGTVLVKRGRGTGLKPVFLISNPLLFFLLFSLQGSIIVLRTLQGQSRGHRYRALCVLCTAVFVTF